MRALLLVAAMAMVGCDDGGEAMVLRDYAETFGQAAEDNAIGCDKVRADDVAEMVVAQICGGADCSAPPRCDVHLDECVTQLLDMPCDSDAFPSACLDMYPGFACMYGESGHGRS